jgi:hypothetical protein
VVGSAPHVAEPDAALCLDLLEVRAAVGSEDERDLVLAPGTTGECEVRTVSKPHVIGRCKRDNLIQVAGNLFQVGDIRYIPRRFCFTV